MSKPLTPAEVAAARGYAKKGAISGLLALRLCDEIERGWVEIEALLRADDAFDTIPPRSTRHVTVKVVGRRDRPPLLIDPGPPAPEAEDTATWPTGEVPF